MDLLDLFKTKLTSSSSAASKNTVKSYLSDVRHFISWYENTMKSIFEAKYINCDVILLYEKSMGGIVENSILKHETKLSTTSLRRHLSSLRKFFAILKQQNAIEKDPFSEMNEKVTLEPTDYWHLRSFADFLLVGKISKMTVKNYVSDIRGFANWYEQAVLPELDKPLSSTDGFYLINQEILNAYKDRLSQIQNAAPRTVNRKLSALRSYLNFATKKGFITTQELRLDPVEVYDQKILERDQPLLTFEDIDSIRSISKPTYSTIPPVRLVQKLIIFPYLSLEEKSANVIASIIAGKPVSGFQKLPESLVRKLKGKNLLRRNNQLIESMIGPSNFQKEFYAPEKVSLLGQPLYKRIAFHLRFTRPDWYRKYHDVAFVHYAHFALLVIFATGIGTALYQNLIAKRQQPTFATKNSSITLPFQARLTDNRDLPITTPTDLRFMIYNDPTASGAALLWQEVHYQITPKSDGTFSVILGQNKSISSSILSNNTPIYLGLTVGRNEELAPRRRIAGTEYATTTQFLQGLPPSTQAGLTSLSNVILALDSAGNLILSDESVASHTFQINNGTFKLSGDTLLLTTNTGTDSNVVVSPDGSGKLDIQKPIINTTTGGLLSGGVEIHDKFGVYSTESEVAAFVVNNNTFGGDIIAASSSGTTRFVIANDGTLISSVYNAQNGVLYGTQSTGVIAQVTTLTQDLCLKSGGSSPSWGSCNSGIISSPFNTINEAIVPIHTAYDLLVGGLSTNSAKFRFINNGTGTPVASISANLGNNATFISGDGTLGTTNRHTLTIGNSLSYNTTGNIILNPNGIGNIGIGTYNPLATLDVRGYVGTQPAASISANSSAPALLVNQEGSGDLFVASRSGGLPGFRVRSDGNVVVGTGGIGTKIYAETLDPLYNIDGKKYSTYSPSMLGFKEEITGREILTYNAKIGAYIYVFDFNNTEHESDFWVFSRVIKPDIKDVSVLMTPNSPARTWYKKDGTNRTITLYADRPVEISYRMTAPQINSDLWTTIADVGSYDVNGVDTPPPPNPIGNADGDNNIPVDHYFESLSVNLQNGNYILKDSNYNTLNHIDAFSRVIVGTIQTGLIQAYKTSTTTLEATSGAIVTLTGTSLAFVSGTFSTLNSSVSNLGKATTSSLSVTTDSVSIAGKSLQIYIEEVVQDLLDAQYLIRDTSLLSPIAQISELKTNLISPLADTSAPSLSFQNSKFSIQNSNSTVAWFDNQGNASFSGQLTANNISANSASISGYLTAQTGQFDSLTIQQLSYVGDASISGTIRTNNLIAGNIEGLDSKLATLAAAINSNQQTVNNRQGALDNSQNDFRYAQPSPTTISPQPNPDTTNYNLLTTQTLEADFGIFEQGIASMGPITATDITAMDNLSVGTNFSISNNAINTLGSVLALQSLRQADIVFQGGLIRMDTDGNMQIAGNLNILGEIDAVHGVFSGTLTSPSLATNLISPLPGDNLIIKLSAVNSLNSSKLTINDGNNREVLSVNQKGDIQASGAATFSKLNFNFVGEAIASSLTEATSSGSAGFASLRAGQPEITIKNPNITSESLIYITPFGDTKNRVLYLLRQTPQTNENYGSFTVGASGTSISQNLQFNWLIVN